MKNLYLLSLCALFFLGCNKEDPHPLNGDYEVFIYKYDRIELDGETTFEQERRDTFELSIDFPSFTIPYQAGDPVYFLSLDGNIPPCRGELTFENAELSFNGDCSCFCFCLPEIDCEGNIMMGTYQLVNVPNSNNLNLSYEDTQTDEINGVNRLIVAEAEALLVRK